MSILDATKYTLQGVANHLDPTGRIARVAEVLSVPLGVVADIPWVEGNLATGHQSTLRSSLPQGSVRQINYGVASEKETAKPQVDTCMMLETYSEVDQFLMKVNGNSPAFRWQKDKAFLEGLNQTFARNLFYSNSGEAITHTAGIGAKTYTVDAKNFDGLCKRYASSSSVAGENVLTAYGTSASGAVQNSIWLIGWAEDKVYGIYPKATKAGLDMEDKGLQTVIDDGSTHLLKHEAWITHFLWYCGICVEDWRYIVRIGNIDTALIASITDLSKFMVQAIDMIPDITACRPVFYMNRFVKTTLRQQAAGKTNIWYDKSEFGGPPVEMFQTVPIHRCDMLGSTEAEFVGN
jgi:hypothetical protein